MHIAAFWIPLWLSQCISYQNKPSNFKQNNHFLDKRWDRKLWLYVVSKDRHLLLLNCFIASLRCISMVRSAYGSAYGRVLDHNQIKINVSSTTTKSQISSKITNFRRPVSPGNMMLCRKNVHPLLFECFISFLRCIRMMSRLYGSLCDPLMVDTQCLFTKTNSQIPSKINNFGQQINPGRWLCVV